MTTTQRPARALVDRRRWARPAAFGQSFDLAGIATLLTPGSDDLSQGDMANLSPKLANHVVRHRRCRSRTSFRSGPPRRAAPGAAAQRRGCRPYGLDRRW